jgi:hypothetical protein
MVPKLSLRFTRNRDTRILGFDEDRSSRRLDCLPEVSGETLVPAAPQRRLVWDRLESQLLAEVRAVIEVVDECCFVLPPVEFLQ